MRLNIEGDIPSVNEIWRKAPNGKIYLTKKASDFKQYLAWTAISSKFKPLKGKVKFYMEVHRKKELKGDLDNKIKVCQDALNEIAYNDDKQIKEIHVVKVENSTFDGAIIEVTQKE